MKKILITGKDSYIGDSFRKYAEEHYAEEFQISTVDMIDGSWRENSFAGYDAVLHVAGIAHADAGRVSEETKAFYYKINRDLAIETAEKAKKDGIKQFIFMSSMIVYGGLENITKDTEPQPKNFYGDSKWQADKGVRSLQDETFRVSVLRPPMVYGKGSKGNYPALEKLAKTSPLFPKVKNKRSMLYIENLCEFLCMIIRKEEQGIFFPQNEEYVNTSELVRQIAEISGHRIWITSLFSPVVSIGKHMPGKIGVMCRKAFGNSCYEMDMSRMKTNYRIMNFKETIKRTEGLF